MKKIAIVLSILMLAVVCAGAYRVYALTPDSGLMMGRGGHGPRHNLLRALIKLNLTEQQKHDIAVILKDNRDGHRNKARSMREARENLLDLILADQFNEDAVRQAARQLASHGEQIAVERARIFAEIRKILTPEQQAVIRQLRVDLTSRAREHVKGRTSLLDEWIETHSK